MNTLIQNRAIPLTLTWVWLVLSSCQTNVVSPPVVTTASGNAVRGVVVMRDEYRKKIDDCSIAIVTVANGHSTYSDTVSANGEWEIPDLPAGIYQVDVSAPGYSGLVLNDLDMLPTVQYGGVDVLVLQELRLGKDIASNLFSNGTSTVTYKYRYDLDDPTRIVDSSAVATLTFDSENLDWKGYSVALSDSQTADCSQKQVVSGGGPLLPPVGNKITWDASDLSDYVRGKYGHHPPLLYFLVRPVWDKRSTSYGTGSSQCSAPLVIPIQF